MVQLIKELICKLLWIKTFAKCKCNNRNTMNAD